MAHFGERNAYFWATHTDAELDLLIVTGKKRYGFEIKYSETPHETKSMHTALKMLKLDLLEVIYPGKEVFFLADKIVAKPLEIVLREQKKNT